MKVFVRDYKPIVIPSALAVKEDGAFSGRTPYVAKLATRLDKKGYIENKLPCKLLCLESVKKAMVEWGGYKSFAEPLAGVGLSTRIFDNGGKLYLNDYDEGCFKILKKNFKGNITRQDVLKMPIPKADAVFLDFNDFTMRRFVDGPYKDVVSRCMVSAKKFVVVNDCSVFYFRYGKGSYKVYSKLLGEKIRDTKDYFVVLRSYLRQLYPEWSLVHVAYFRDTSFLLFAKTEKSPLHVVYVEKPEATFVRTGM